MKPKVAGRKARTKEEPKSSCPYKPGMAASSWHSGWNEANEELSHWGAKPSAPVRIKNVLPDELDGFEVCKGWRTDKHGDDPMGIFEELEGRGARCSCGKIYKSAHNLPFFKFRGEGSEAATKTCHCGYYAVAHTDSARHPITDHQFKARGTYEFDEYYCGCRGWD